MKYLYGKNYFKEQSKLSYRPQIFKCVKAVREYRPKSVLDIGCGEGYLVKWLKGDKEMKIIGVDFSEYAGKLIPDNFIKADANNLPFPDNSFDVVISKDFFEHLPEEQIDNVYKEMQRVGKYIIALICFKEQEPYHLTVKPLEWWQNKLPKCKIIE